MIGIYKFTNRYNRKCYIGQSIDIEERYKMHKYNAIKGIKGYFYNAIRKYGFESFDFKVLIECSKENLNYWEKFYIRMYCSNNPDWGYNQTDGGDGLTLSGELNGMFGKHHSEETRKKMSEHYKYHTYERSEEQRNILRNNLIGNKHFLGKRHSEETRKKMSESAKKIWQQRKINNTK